MNRHIVRFCKPKTVRSLDMLQDGGLQHNNPVNIAQWEARYFWPSKPEPDFSLSLGMGTSSTTASGRAITKSRFYMRIFKSFIRSLDGEDALK
jgi:hypothetical protein